MSVEKQLGKYIVPNVFAMVGISCYILADTFFISVAEGADGITALNLVLPVYGVIYALGAMIGIGSATRFSLLRAMGNDEAEDYFSSAVFWELLVSLVFVGLGVFCPEKVLVLMGADVQILGVGTPYLKIALCFAPCFMLNYTFTAFVRNDGAPKIAMAATLSSSIFNILFDYVLMFPLGFGMRGAALATGLSPLVSMGICMVHYLSKRNTIRFRWLFPSAHRLAEACKLGVVAFVGEIASGITTFAFNYILLSLGGNIAVAAYGVIANIALVGTSIFNGVAQGLQPLASEAHGRADREAEERILKRSTAIGLGLAAALVVLVWIFAPQCVAVFNSENVRRLADYAVVGLRIYFVGFLFAAVNIVRAGFLSATGCARESAAISIFRGIVAIVVFAFLLSKLWGITGVWLSFPATELVTLLLGFLRRKRSNM